MRGDFELSIVVVYMNMIQGSKKWTAGFAKSGRTGGNCRIEEFVYVIGRGWGVIKIGGSLGGVGIGACTLGSHAGMIVGFCKGL